MKKLTKENIDAIPVEIRYEDRWVNWNSKKAPIDPKKKGSYAKCNDPSTWGTFNQALINTTAEGSELGVGFSLGEDFCCLDFDHVVNPETGEWYSEEAKEIFDSLEGVGYAEWSPSGDGIHVVFWCTKPTGIVSKKKLGSVPWTDKESAIEFFGANGEDAKHRYITVTGNTKGFEHFRITKVPDAIVARVGARHFKKRNDTAPDYVAAEYHNVRNNISSTLDRYVDSIIRDTRQSEGGRNSKMFTIAGNVAAHASYDFDRTLAACMEINQKCFSPPLDQRELYRVVDNSINKGTRRIVNPLSSPSLDAAIQVDNVDPISWINDIVEEEKETHTFDFEALRKSNGLIGRYMRYMLLRSDLDMPKLQLAGALSLLSSCLTGKIEVRGKRGVIAPNLYVAGFAPSGFGKSQFVDINHYVMEEIGCEHRRGPEKMTSGPGFEKELGNCSVTSLYYDEFHDLFKGEGDSKLASGKSEVMKMSQTKSGKDYKPSCYADPTKNVDIKYCAPTISGWGVGELWWENLPKWAISDGLLGRALIFEESAEVLDTEKDIEGDGSIPSSIIEWLRKWGHEGQQTLLEDKGAQPRQVVTFTYEPSAEDIMDKWTRKIRRKGATDRTELTDAWNQSGRKVAKLACLFAADEFGADGDTIICDRHVLLAISLVKATMYAVQKRIQSVSSDETVKLAQEVEKRLKKTRGGMTMKKIHSFWKTRLFSDIEKAVEHLIKTDCVDAETFKARNNVPRIVHVEHVASLIEESENC